MSVHELGSSNNLSTANSVFSGYMSEKDHGDGFLLALSLYFLFYDYRTVRRITWGPYRHSNKEFLNRAAVWSQYDIFANEMHRTREGMT